MTASAVSIENTRTLDGLASALFARGSWEGGISLCDVPAHGRLGPGVPNRRAWAQVAAGGRQRGRGRGQSPDRSHRRARGIAPSFPYRASRPSDVPDKEICVGTAPIAISFQAPKRPLFLAMCSSPPPPPSRPRLPLARYRRVPVNKPMLGIVVACVSVKQRRRYKGGGRRES